jgi:hypothetical protein
MVWAAALVGGLIAASVTLATLPTTIRDYFLGGTQPLTLVDNIESVTACAGCHGNFNLDSEPYRPWAASMMGQSARDPVFHAALAIANQDATFGGDLCLRCHTPGGWLGGRSEPTNGSALLEIDMQGVNCNFCHRMVDPVLNPGSPEPDAAILAALTTPPTNPHSGNYIIDPYDRRRGPYDLGPEFIYHQWLQSPFHTRSNMCATCHDVSNPVVTKQPNGTYALNTFDTPHPDGDKYNMFPLERTFSEWSQSTYAAGPVNVNGRFGGDLPAVSSCQDCHMPTTSGQACRWTDPRDQLHTHQLNGGNTWVLRAVRNLYPDATTGLSDTTVTESIDRTKAMIAKASDMELSILTGTAPQLNVRIINHSGHKLPTGYAEGRRMWINVQFLNSKGNIISERGGYNFATADLDTSSTKVYEGKMGIDAEMAAVSGAPAGPGFHFILNNVWHKDNRIPPPGFTNAGFAAVQAAPVGATYADGQHWDDTLFAIPAGTANARVTVYFQTTSKEYIEFLRDKNTTNNTGIVAYEQWLATGKSEPAVVDVATIAIPCYANCDGSTASPVLTANDFQCFMNKYVSGDPYANCDGSTGSPSLTANDFQCFLIRYANGC